MPSGVLVVSELDQGGVNSTTRELLAVGRKLADELGEELSAAVLAGAAGDLAQTLFSHGADKVYAVSHDLLQDYQADLQLAALEKVCTEASPNIILIGRTLIGREIAPRLAFRLGVGLAQDCLEVRIDDNGRLVANRPVYGGSCMASVTCMGTPQIAAIRPKVYEPLEGDPSRSGETVDVSVDLDPSMAKVKVVQVVKEESEGRQAGRTPTSSSPAAGALAAPNHSRSWKKWRVYLAPEWALPVPPLTPAGCLTVGKWV